MKKDEGRAILKSLQGIVNNKADEDAPTVVQAVREYIATLPDDGDGDDTKDDSDGDERDEGPGRDRRERGGLFRRND